MELVPLRAVIVISTVPADSAGAIALIDVSLMISKLVAGLVPKMTAVALLKPFPEIVTVIPPIVGPDEGLTLVTVGGGMKVN